MTTALPPHDFKRGWFATPLIQRLSADHGRTAAAALIVVMAIGFAAFGASAWNPVRNLLFDAYQRSVPREVERFPVSIVDIDDASLAAIGRWPWPRTQLAQLIEATHRLGALAVGLDILMPEPDSLLPGPLISGRSEISPACVMHWQQRPPTTKYWPIPCGKCQQ